MTDRWFEELARITDFDERSIVRAPARLKSRIYSAIVRQQAADGPLLSLTEVKASGRDLCVFEAALRVMPLGERVKMMNPCRICHARVLGERLDHAPIFWPSCPYSEFHND
jgi:hypothetical protein